MQLRGVVKCPKCGSKDLTPARPFNLMFKTSVGPVDMGDDSGLVYMRPETAQGIFVNFGNVLDTMRRKLPFGIAQVGKELIEPAAVPSAVLIKTIWL